VLKIFSSSDHVKVEEARAVGCLVMLQLSEHDEYAGWVDMSNVQAMVTGRTRMTGWLTSAIA
jgi:hypothetical protein